MLVEFRDSEFFGNALFIKGSELLKADKNSEEFGSMAFALDAFGTLKNINIDLGTLRDLYDEIKKKVNKGDMLVFSPSGRYRQDRRIDILVSVNSDYKRIACIEWNGEFFIEE